MHLGRNAAQLMEGAPGLTVAVRVHAARCAAVAGCAAEGGTAQGRRLLPAGQTLAHRARGFARGVVRFGHHDIVRPLHLHAALELGDKARDCTADGKAHQQAERGKLRRRDVGAQQERLVHAADRAFPCATLPAVAGGLPQAAHGQTLGLAFLDSALDQVVRRSDGLKRLHTELHPQYLSLLIWRRGARPRKTVMGQQPSSTSREPRAQRPCRGRSHKPNAPHRKAPTIAQADDPAPDPASPTPESSPAPQAHRPSASRRLP